MPSVSPTGPKTGPRPTLGARWAAAGFAFRYSGLTCPTVGATVDFNRINGQAPPDHLRLPDERVRLRARRVSPARATLGADRRRERSRPDPRQHLRDPREGRGQGVLEARRAALAQGPAARARHWGDGLHGA